MLLGRESRRAFVYATWDFSLVPCTCDVRLYFISDNALDSINSILNTNGAAVVGS